MDHFEIGTGQATGRGSPLVARTLALAAFCTALLVSWLTGRFAQLDRWEYSEIADNILSGRGAFYDYLSVHYYFYGQPLYPLLIAAIRGLTGSEQMVIVVQAMLLAAIAFLIYKVALHAWGERVALLAGSMVAFHPGLLIYAGRLHSELIDVFAIVLAYALWLRLNRDAGATRGMVTGVGLAFGMLCRGTMIPVTLAWLARLAWRGRGEMARTTIVLRALTVGIVLTMSPFVARGCYIYGTVVPLRSDVGINMWKGNHAGASGTLHTLEAVPRPVTVHLTNADLVAVSRMNEVEQSEYFSSKAQSWIATEPQAASALFLRKLWYFWWSSPHTGLLYPHQWTQIYTSYYSLVVLLALVGLATAAGTMSRAGREAAVVFVIMALFGSMTQAMFYVEGRHRWHFEPMLLLFAAVGCDRLVRAALDWRTTRLAPQSAALLD